MKKLWNFLENFRKKIFVYIQIPICIFKNKEYSSPWKLLLLNAKIEWLYLLELINNPVTYNINGKAYQAFQKIASGLKNSRKDINGKVETVERRFENYRLGEIISPSMRVLDIGANSCFLSVLVAQKVHSVTAVEPNMYLVKVGSTVANYFDVNNINFVNKTFEDYFNIHFKENKYDLILSLAAFHTGDGGERSAAKDYLKKIDSILADGGYLLFESVKINEKNENNREREVSTIICEIESSFRLIRKQKISYQGGRCRYVLLAQK